MDSKISPSELSSAVYKTDNKSGQASSAGIIPGSIDAHQHFWYYEKNKHDWISDDMAVIRRSFLPEHIQPLLQNNGIEGCIAVQADQAEEETDFLLQLAKENDFIKGIVGWVDLRSADVRLRLQYYHQFPKIKGFRHVLQGESPEFMLQPSFLEGIRALKEFNFTYDILVFPQHLEAVLQLVRLFPEQAFVIDHIAKPFIKSGLISEWEKGMRAIAQCQNVYCKISGMVTEADYQHWKKEDFKPYLDLITNSFGINRIMYGSDWPVCQVAASYEQVRNIVKEYFSNFSMNEQVLLFRDNAKKFYGIE